MAFIADVATLLLEADLNETRENEKGKGKEKANYALKRYSRIFLDESPKTWFSEMNKLHKITIIKKCHQHKFS